MLERNFLPSLWDYIFCSNEIALLHHFYKRLLEWKTASDALYYKPMAKYMCRNRKLHYSPRYGTKSFGNVVDNRAWRLPDLFALPVT